MSAAETCGAATCEARAPGVCLSPAAAFGLPVALHPLIATATPSAAPSPSTPRRRCPRAKVTRWVMTEPPLMSVLAANTLTSADESSSPPRGGASHQSDARGPGKVASASVRVLPAVELEDQSGQGEDAEDRADDEQP